MDFERRSRGHVTITLDSSAASRKAAGGALEFLAREAGLAETACRNLIAAFSVAGRALSAGNSSHPGELRCDVATRRGEVMLRIWAHGPAGKVQKPDTTLVRSLARKVSRVEWTRSSGSSKRSG